MPRRSDEADRDVRGCAGGCRPCVCGVNQRCRPRPFYTIDPRGLQAGPDISIAWFGPSGLLQSDRVYAMLVQTRWGQAWAWTFLTALLATVGLLVARFVPAVRPVASLGATIAAVVATPQIEHAAGYGSLVWILHSAHLLGTGLWIGTLLVLASHSWSVWREQSASAPALRQLLAGITPVALVGAGIGVASGTWISAAHVWPPQTAFDTSYGSTFGLKILMVALVALFGWLNWRRFGPRAERAEGRRQLRTSIVLELILGFVAVLVLTAWLSGLPTPI